MPNPPLPIRELPNGVQFSIRIHPGARREGVTGIHSDALKLSISAPAVDGRANDALIRFLATLLHVPRANIEILSGQTSRSKLIRVLGITLPDAQSRLAQL